MIVVGLVKAGRVLRSWEIDGETATIGSSDSCNITARGDKSIRPHHATIYAEDGELTVVPEEGAEVYLNGDLVDFAVPDPGDIVKIGKMKLRLEWRSQDDDDDTEQPGYDDAPTPTPAPAREPEQQTAPDEHDLDDTADLSEDDATDIEAPRPTSAQTLDPTPFGELPTAIRDLEDMPPLDHMVDDDLTEEKETALLPVSEEEMEAGMATLSDDGPATVEENPSEAETVDTQNEPPTDESFAPSEDDEDAWLDDEDDDEDEEWVEPFDLAALLLERRPEAPAEGEQGKTMGYCTALVVRVIDGRVVETVRVPSGSWSSDDGLLSLAVQGDTASLTMKDGIEGEVRTPDPAGVLPGTVNLPVGGSALLTAGDVQWRIDVFRPPKPGFGFSMGGGLGLFLLVPVALAAHLVVGIAMAAVTPEWAPVAEQEEEVFAEVKFEDAAEEPEPEPPDTQELAERAPAVAEAAVEEVVQRPRPPATVDSLLERLTAAPANNAPDLAGAVSNIAAVPTADGTAGSPFNIAGAIGKIDGDGVSVGRMGDGTITTQSGDQVAGKAGKLAPGKRGKVRGRVTKISSQIKVQGTLSREEVSRVVNSHIHQIQGCYERELLNNAGLSGRIVFDWTVQPDGSVKGVRVRSSTLQSNKVADCIGGLIKKWKFASPKGGEVTISYPFLFRSVAQ